MKNNSVFPKKSTNDATIQLIDKIFYYFLKKSSVLEESLLIFQRN